MAHRIFQQDDLRNAEVAWCLDFRWLGRTFRLSTHHIELELPDSSTVQYVAGMTEPDVVDAVERNGIHDSATAPIGLYLDGFDIAEEVARGNPLERAEGELFMVFVDRTTGKARHSWEERYSFLTGRLSQPQYAHPDQAPGYMQFSLVQQVGEDNSLLLPANAVLNRETWPDAPGKFIGKIYPVVIGNPGLYQQASGGFEITSGSPGYPIKLTLAGQRETLLIAGHDVQADSVIVYMKGLDEGHTYDVVQVKDGLNRTVSIVSDLAAPTSSGTPTTAFLESDEYWVHWPTGNGGLIGGLDNGLISGLGDVVVWALLLTSLPVDLLKWQNESALLNQIQVACYINEPTLTPWSWVSGLLDELFIEVRTGPRGLYPMVRRFESSTAEGVASVVEGPEFEPLSAVTVNSMLSDVINQVTMRFAVRADTGDYLRQLTLGPSINPNDDEHFVDEYAAASVDRWSIRTTEPIIQAESLELDWLYDETSVSILAAQRIRAQGFGFIERTYLAAVHLGWLAPGVSFRLESESLHRDYFATVLSRKWVGVAWELVIAMDIDPVRDAAQRTV